MNKGRGATVPQDSIQAGRRVVHKDPQGQPPTDFPTPINSLTLDEWFSARAGDSAPCPATGGGGGDVRHVWRYFCLSLLEGHRVGGAQRCCSPRRGAQGNVWPRMSTPLTLSSPGLDQALKFLSLFFLQYSKRPLEVRSGPHICLKIHSRQSSPLHGRNG